MIGKKIAHIIISAGKTKSKKKENERPEIYILPVKRQQINDNLKLTLYKNGIPKKCKFAW